MSFERFSRSTRAAAGLVGGFLCSVLLVGAQRAPARPLPATEAAPGMRLAQLFGPGFGTGGGIPGGGVGRQGAVFPGGGLPGGGLPGGGLPGGGLPGVGLPGGALPGGGLFLGLAPGQAIRVAALCTELSAEPPDGATRFSGGEASRVLTADGRTGSLAEALAAGLLALRGRDAPLDPFRRSLALELQLVNTSRAPVRVLLAAADTVTPLGQAEQRLPAGAERLFALAQQERADLNTLQIAVWAARGSTAEEVEQANLIRLSEAERQRVQRLLDAAGLDLRFDRDRGAFERRFAARRSQLGGAAAPIEGTLRFPSGERASVEGVRTPEGAALLVLRPSRGGAFYYAAEFDRRKDGREAVRLFHLTTGRPLRIAGGTLPFTPKG